jgi:hypothetical protein
MNEIDKKTNSYLNFYLISKKFIFKVLFSYLISFNSTLQKFIK